MEKEELIQILQQETDGFENQSRLRDDVVDAMRQCIIKSLTQVLEQQTEIRDHNDNDWRVVESSDIENIIEAL